MDVVTPKRDRAREGLRKLDLVMLAATINVNYGSFAAFGQDAALALDRMPESHDAEFRDAAAFCEQLALALKRTNPQSGGLKLFIPC